MARAALFQYPAGPAAEGLEVTFPAEEKTADRERSHLDDLLSIFDLVPLDDTHFQAPTPSGGDRLFGGQVGAQSLLAACMTVDSERVPHSLHAYFTRRGKPGSELLLEVESARDGRTFATRHVRALQDGAPILEMMVSFQSPEEAPEFQFALMPEVPGPDKLSPIKLFWSASNAFDVRPINPGVDGNRPGRLHPFWIRLRANAGRDPITSACLLVYLSDIAFMGVAAIPGVELNRGGSGSLDHAVWFHSRYDPTQWLLFSSEPISNTGARGLARGSLFSADGRLVASLAQEALLRPS